MRRRWPRSAAAPLETSNDHVNPDNPPWYQRPNGAIHVLFSRRELTALSRTSGEPYERSRAAIDAEHRRVFIGTSDRGLYALRAGNGSTLWRFETLAPVQSEPLYDGELDVVYFGSNDGALYAVHAADGALVWRYDSGGEVGRKPVLAGETLFFANGADNLFAIDRRTGKSLWRVHRSSALGMEVSGYAGPALDQGMVFFAFSDGHVGAYDARDGSERWTPVDLSAEAEQSAGGEALRYLDVDTTPVPDDLGAAGRVVFVASYAGGVYALDEERGAPLVEKREGAGCRPISYSGASRRIAVPPDDPSYVPGGPEVPSREMLPRLERCDRPVGASIRRTGGGCGACPYRRAGSRLRCRWRARFWWGTTRYGAFLLSPLDGRPIDGVDLGSGFSQAPAAFGNRAFVLSNGGTLLGLQVDPPR